MSDNQSPTNIRLRGTNVAEATPGAAVGRLRAVDPDPGDTATFSVDDGRFFVTETGRLKLRKNATLDFETEATITVTVTATDAGGLSVARSFSLTVLDGDPELGVVSLDGPLLDNRLVFSHLDMTDGREDKSVATLRIANTGTDTLNIADLALSGPFAFVDPAQDAATSVAVGGTLEIEIAFDRSLYDPETDPDVFTGALTITSDDPDEASLDVPLAGFWQREPERGQEPTVNEIWQVYGYANTVDIAALDNFDLFEAVNAQEVLSPYWRLADGATEVTVTWLASYHGFNKNAAIEVHAPGDEAARFTLFTQVSQQNQTLLPVTTGGTTPIASFDAADIPNAWDGEDVFGFRVQEESSDPTLNDPGPGTAPDPDAQRGHLVRFFQALDAEGVPIPDTYLVIQDYNSRGINYDYNDNMLLVSGITPADAPLA